MLKNSSMGLRAAIVLAAVPVAAVSAQAAPISVDAAPWDLVDGKSSLSVGDVTATAGPFSNLSYDTRDDLGSQVSYTGVLLDDELTSFATLDATAKPGPDGSPAADPPFKEEVALSNDEPGGTVPEPTSLMLLGAALLVGAERLRRRK